MKLVFRILLIILLFTIGSFAGLCTVISLPRLASAFNNLFKSPGAEMFGYMLGTLFAFFVFFGISFLSIRTGIRIIKKIRLMKLNQNDSFEVLDDGMN